MRTILRGATLEERFMASIDTMHATDCWRWIGAFEHGGPILGVGKKNRPAPRIAWELHHGVPFPAGRIAFRICFETGCVNPHHVLPCTRAEKNLLVTEAERHSHGEKNGGAKLSEAQAEEVRQRRQAGESAQELAQEFGVSDTEVYNIGRFKRWRLLKSEN